MPPQKNPQKLHCAAIFRLEINVLNTYYSFVFNPAMGTN